MQAYTWDYCDMFAVILLLLFSFSREQDGPRVYKPMQYVENCAVHLYIIICYMYTILFSYVEPGSTECLSRSGMKLKQKLKIYFKLSWSAINE